MPLKALKMEMSGKLYLMSCILNVANVTATGVKISSWGMKKPLVITMVCGPPKDHHMLTDI